MAVVSRREVISIGVAAGLGAILPADLIAGISSSCLRRTTWLGLERFNGPSPVGDLLRLRSASDSAGLNVLDRSFPGLTSDAGFQRFLPIAFLVTNVSQTDIRVFSTLWTLTTPTGRHQINIAYCNHPQPGRMSWYPKKRSRKPVLVTGRTPVISAGTTRLITPLFSCGPRMYEEDNEPNWGMLWRQGPKILSSEPISESLTVVPELDAAITDDYAAIGPGAASLGRFFCIARNAEHDEAVSVRRQIEAGASLEGVLSNLRREASAIEIEIPDPSALYYNVRRRQARVFIRRLKTRGWDQFLRTLEFVANQPKTVIAL